MPESPPADLFNKKARIESPDAEVLKSSPNAESEETKLSFAPGEDADYFAEEDEDGRFFGGGLTAEQKQILNIFDNAPSDRAPEEVGKISFNISFTTT